LTDIIKFETFDRDQEYILLKYGIKDLVKNPEKRNTKGIPRSSSNLTQFYVDQLSDDLFKRIIDFYLVDFQIFGYPLPVQSKLYQASDKSR
jgi:hypothetical protein